MHLGYSASLQALHSNIRNKYLKCNITGLKTPTGRRQLAIYKRGQWFELRTTKNKSSKWPEQDSNQGPPDCKCQGFELRTTRTNPASGQSRTRARDHRIASAKDLNSGQPEQTQQVARAGLEDCQSDALTTKKGKEKYFSSDIDDSHRNLPKRA